MNCSNPLNKYFVEELAKMKRQAEYRNTSQFQARVFSKIIQSVCKYPLPIISHEQALMLEGVGDTSARIFQKLISKREEKFLKEHGEEADRIAMSREENRRREELEEDKEEEEKKQGLELEEGKRQEIEDNGTILSQYILEQDIILNKEGKNTKLKRRLDKIATNQSNAKKYKREILFEEGAQNWIYLLCAHLAILQNSQITQFNKQDLAPIFDQVKTDIGHVGK